MRPLRVDYSKQAYLFGRTRESSTADNVASGGADLRLVKLACGTEY